VIGEVPSTPTVWRALSEVGELQLTRVNTAVTGFRRHWWGLLAQRREGFPWLRVAGRELTGVTVVDMDASLVFAASEKENAQPTYQGGIGFCPNLATCDNTDDMLAIDPRPGGATSHCAADNIALLDLAVSRLPGRYRRRVLVRLDGAGFSHDLLEHIAAGAGVKGRDWEFSVGWSCTDKEMDAIEQLPAGGWTGGIDQNGDPVKDTFVADLTGLLDLRRWQTTIPDLRITVRDEPLHPRYRKRATEREKQLGRRYQLIATNTHLGQIAWLDARHRSHTPRRERRHTSQGPGPEPVAVTALGDQRGLDPDPRPGREPARLLPPPRTPRREAPQRRPETAALPTAAPTRPTDPRATKTVAAPTRGLALDRRRDQRLACGHSTRRAHLTTTTKPRRSWKDHRPERGTRRPRCDSRTPTLPTNRKP